MRRRKSDETIVTEEPMLVGTIVDGTVQNALKEIRSYEGVIGYIFRNTTSAMIDLKDPSRMVDYAILSSAAFEASSKLSEIFDLGETETIIVEGSNCKMLSLAVNDNRISVFMERNAETDKIITRLQ